MAVISTVLEDEGARPGESIHSWRCEHPDRYGECDCVGGTAALILAAIEGKIRNDEREQIAIEVRRNGWAAAADHITSLKVTRSG